jgi:ABC-type transporter Mla subunit MlaD
MTDRELQEAVALLKTALHYLGDVAEALAQEADNLRFMLAELNHRLQALVEVMEAVSSYRPGPVH